jgi:glycosyltransferase involved in cell wall biosynthesis
VAPRISVIVAVYNPGPHFDDLIDSFLRQSLPPEQFEVLLCDDGSDEATQERLDAVSAKHSHLKVIKLEHSGWPGTPRNVGIDTAAGKYVFFCDHDDTFGDEALERLANYADENQSDVVVGKLTGAGRTLPRGMFRENIPNAVLGRDPLLEILTPHKLFRTEFIREHGIRFPDGKVRLEDHMFVMKAYFAAERISILADYPCYYWTKRTDQPSASANLIVPEYYYRYLGVVLDIVEENVPPGPERDAMIQHWYRGKVLKRLAGRHLLRYTDEYRTELLDCARSFTLSRFSPAVDKYLTFPMRIRSALLRANRVDGLLRLAEIESSLTSSARVTSIRWDDDNRLRLDVEARVYFEDGSDLEFDPSSAGTLPLDAVPAIAESTVAHTEDAESPVVESVEGDAPAEQSPADESVTAEPTAAESSTESPSTETASTESPSTEFPSTEPGAAEPIAGSPSPEQSQSSPDSASAGPSAAESAASEPTQWRWRPPQALPPEVVTDDLLEAGADLQASRIEVFVRARHDGSDYVQPEENTETRVGPGVLRTTITIDPRTARAGRAVTKYSDLVALVNYVGWNFGTSLRIDPEILAAANLSERVIGRRVFTVGTRGTDRLFLRARRLPPAPKPIPPVVVKASPVLRVRVVGQARRVAGQVRRRLLSFMQ